MKKVLVSIFTAAILVAVFFLGRYSNNWRTEVLHNADGILAYQHYYEATEDILSNESNDSILKDHLMREYNLAKMQVDQYKNQVVMTWPEVCDQRDMLSDAIRCYADYHPDCENPDDNIMNYVSEFGINPDMLGNWSYSY